MREIIDQINLSIDEKRNRLKEKAERYFTTIVVPNSPVQHQQACSNQKKVPPISYLLYGLAGASAIVCLASDSKLLFGGVAAACAYGGYTLSNKNKGKEQKSSIGRNQNIDLNSVKTDVTSKVIDSIKRITSEWEEFMALKQKEIQSAIKTSSFDEEKKDSMSSKTYIYQVIDISLSDFYGMLKSVASIDEVKQKVELFKVKLLAAIDNAAAEQMKEYNSLLD